MKEVIRCRQMALGSTANASVDDVLVNAYVGWNFGAHFAELAPRVTTAAGALTRLMPNLGGPEASCRRLYMGVVRSIALYGAPVWADALSRQNLASLRRPQRLMATRAARGYRTISFEAASVLAGSIPWDLEAKTLASLFFWREEAVAQGHRLAPREIAGRRNELCQRSIEEWSQRLEQPTAGRRTVEAVRPVLGQWLARQHGSLTYRLTQMLSGHGCFGGYLCLIGRGPSAVCHHCDGCADEDAQHTLEVCPAWDQDRAELRAVVGDDLSLPAVVRQMVDSERSWTAVQTFAESVMLRKVAAERVREDTSDLPIRRRRTGRRRRAYALPLLPPQ
ncbi:uncharacterized protein LOC132904440 [Amyelois transitella]|uniref:uncharacterized protein LOC132904440 n=1 Tax=Amyelois transitella TaxID=680683 RepID=UPI00298F7D54|nr:uncharacterized protein LOC132904440 [Amyelois transitella]